MALTKEQSDQLKDFFPVQAHEFLQGKTYIAEEWVTERLDQVDPSWSFERLEIAVRENTVTATFRLTVCGVSRDGVGMDTIKNGAGEAEKSAATDALKRAARLFGIGRYILSMGKAVSDHRSLEAWLAHQRKVNPDTGELKIVQNGTQSHQDAITGDLQQSTDELAQLAQKTPQERLGTPSGQTIAPKAGKWAFDRSALLTALATPAKDYSYQERGNTVKKMDDEGVFATCTTIAEATQLVMARLATHRKEQPA